MKKIIANLLNEMRGVYCKNVSIDKDFCMVIFLCECKFSLSYLLFVKNNFDKTDIFMDSENGFKIEYCLFLKSDHIDDFVKIIKNELLKTDYLREDVNDIKNFTMLDDKSKRKYMKFVKYLRSKFPDGAMALSSNELLENSRICFGCGEELYSKDDEVRAVLEFDNPRKVYKILQANGCGN